MDMRHREGPSVWAAVGAPLVGVPLLVTLLALVAPADGPASAPDDEERTEAIEAMPADVALELDGVEVEVVLREG